MSRAHMAVATAGWVALAAYALLKAAWGLGAHIGITSRTEFDSVFGSLTPGQVWLATWGTVVLAGGGAVLLLTMALGPRLLVGRFRALMRSVVWTVAVLLGGFAVVALAATVVNGGSSPFALWVSYLTYGAFLVYACSLGYLCWSTRPDVHTSAPERRRA